MPPNTKVILSHHDYKETPSDALLEAEVQEMFDAGADIAKIATTALRIEDSARMLALPGKSSGVQPKFEPLKPMLLCILGALARSSTCNDSMPGFNI